MRNTHIAGIINKTKHRFDLFDASSSAWQAGFNIQGKTQMAFSWLTLPQGHRPTPGNLGIIPLTLVKDKMKFRLKYTNERN
jgi:hypothetical protein